MEFECHPPRRLFGLEKVVGFWQVEGANWKKYPTRKEAAENLNWWIGSWYNQKRLHSSLGYKITNEYGKEKKVA